ncbi:hypothetical protein C8J57DRAFT_1227238 [Mycena rebaudengoi]|nr:hypothetical protein C8J57DRAFT_1227238 [Mycena rebaudengoi]
MSKNRGGLSNGVQIKYGGHHRVRAKTVTMKPNRSSAQLRKERETYNSQISSLNFEQRQELIEVDMGDATQYQFMDIDYNDDHDYDDIETAYGTFPPGQEALLQSSAGGEIIFQQLFDGLKRTDSRIRTDRVQITINKWKFQMPRLIDAYLKFKAGGPIKVDNSCSWNLAVLSFSESGERKFSHAIEASRNNQPLLLHGYLGSAPESPSLAFPLEFFEIFRQLHQVCPQFSFDALANALMHIHKLPQSKYLREQISDAYDAYLAILRGVEERVQTALGRKCMPTLLLQNGGGAETAIFFLAAMDGNNSLKLVDATFRGGTPTRG